MKTKVLISFAVTAKLICFFVFTYAKNQFSHDAAHLKAISGECHNYLCHNYPKSSSVWTKRKSNTNILSIHNLYISKGGCNLIVFCDQFHDSKFVKSYLIAFMVYLAMSDLVHDVKTIFHLLYLEIFSVCE